ncbi:redox-sensing transcriptional repressor Rex, partial [Planctomycetota bacterium]
NLAIKSVCDLAGLKKQDIRIAILAVPGKAAQQVADELIVAGIKSILNFSPCHINVPKRVKVVTIDIAMDLAVLPYYMSKK